MLGLAALAAIDSRKPELLRGGKLPVVIVGLIATLFVASALWRRPPAIMMCAGIALTIFSGNWPRLGLPGFPFLPDRILLTGAALALALRAPGARRLAPVNIRGVHLLLLLLVVYATSSSVVDGTLAHQSTVFDLLDRLGAIPFLMFLVASRIFPSARERNWLLATLVGLGAYLGIDGIFQSLGPHSLVFPAYIKVSESAPGAHQAYGPFLSTVSQGYASFGCSVAAVVAFVAWRHSPWRWFAALVVPIGLIGSFLSLERGVWVADVTAILVVALFTPDLRRRVIPAGAATAIVIAGALAISPSLHTTVSGRANDSRSVWDRQNQTAAAVRMIAAHPLFGVGWDNYQNVGLAYFRETLDYPMSGYPLTARIGSNGAQTALAAPTGELHDIYLSYAVELGLVGGVLWLVAVVSGLRWAIFRRGSPELRPWRLGLLALATFFFVVGLFDPLGQNYCELVLWTWAGITVSDAGLPIMTSRKALSL